MKKENDVVRYGLRFHILPDKKAVKRAEELAAFCKKHRIREVHLFFNCEEWNKGHLTEVELRQILSCFRRIVPLLRRSGLTVSLNPWSTVLHCDRGRSLRAGQRFERMVSSRGEVMKAVASPACPKWRKYLSDQYGALASLKFDTIWVEDDFRYHNHGSSDWGGDFSPTMLKLFCRRIGRSVTRGELVKKLVRPGKPHPWRREWLQLWREISEKNMTSLRDAVAVASPGTKLGLMSSNPDVHSAEGRNWEGLFQAMAINGKAIHRPHFASYSETTGPGLIYSRDFLEIQKRLRPPWVESHPEIENGFFSLFNKSAMQTCVQMSLAKIMGSDGLLLNLHPFTGSGVFEERGMGEMLESCYPLLEFLSKKFSRDMIPHGVGVPFKENLAEHLQTETDGDYQQLVGESFSASQLLACYGLGYQIAVSDSVNLLWGKKAWAFTDEELTDVLRKGLWLDAEAAAILMERGFNKYLGITSIGWLTREDSLYSLDRIFTEKSGLSKGLNLSANLFSRILQFKSASPKTQTWTRIYDPMNRPISPGLTVYQNELGGRVAVSAFPLNAELGHWNPNFQRQTLVQNLIKVLAKGTPPVSVTGGPYLLPIDLRQGTTRRVVVLNLWTDPARLQVNLPGTSGVSACTIIKPLHKPQAVKFDQVEDSRGVVITPSAELCQFGLLLVDC